MACNLAGIFVAASFDAIRLIPQPPNSREPQLFNLNFNLPLDQIEGASSYLRAVGGPFPSTTTNTTTITEEIPPPSTRRRNANRQSRMTKFVKSFTRSVCSLAGTIKRCVYEPALRATRSFFQHFLAIFSLAWQSTASSGSEQHASTRAKHRKSAPPNNNASAPKAAAALATTTSPRSGGNRKSESNPPASHRKSMDDAKRVIKRVSLVWRSCGLCLKYGFTVSLLRFFLIYRHHDNRTRNPLPIHPPLCRISHKLMVTTQGNSNEKFPYILTCLWSLINPGIQ